MRDVAVIGVPDARFGEIVCAWVVLRDGLSATEADIVGHCRGALAHYKAPSIVRFVDILPTTPSGKVQKFKMRAAEMAGLSA